MTETEFERFQQTFGAVVRPRALTVTAVLWLFLGASWVLIGMSGVGGALWMTQQLQAMAGAGMREPPSLPWVFWWYPGFAALLGAGGVHYGRLALKLEERGRAGLRRVNIGAALLFGAFVAHWINQVTTNYSYFGTYRIPPTGAQVSMALQGLVCGLLLVAPFLYAAKKLAAREVVSAMKLPTF